MAASRIRPVLFMSGVGVISFVLVFIVCLSFVRVLLARGHVNIEVPEAARAVGGEEKRLAVRSDERLLINGRAVHRGAQVDRRRPGVEGGLPRGNPKVSGAEAAQTVRVQEQLQTIEPDAGALFVQWTVELRHQDGRSP